MGLISGFQKRRLEQKLQSAPSDVDSSIRLASLHHKDGEDKAAIDVLGSGLLRSSSASAAHRLLSELEGWARSERFDPEPGVRQLQALLERASIPQRPELQARLDAVLLERSRLSPLDAASHRVQLLAHARQAVEVAGASPWAKLLLALGHLGEVASVSDQAAAGTALQGLNAQGQDPLFDGRLALARGDLKAASGQAAEAESAYTEAGRLFQDPVGLAEVRLRLGRVARDAGNVEQAVERFNSALNYLGTRPEVVWVHAELARLYVRQNRLDEARARIRAALASPQLGAAEKVDLLLLEADLLAQERQTAEATNVARQALDAAGSGASRVRSLRILADLLAATPEGQPEAVDHYRTLLEVGPSQDEASVRLRLAKALLADRRAAEAMDILEPLPIGQPAPGVTATELGLLQAEVRIAAGEHLRGLEILAQLKSAAPESEEAVEERARQFRRDLASGDLAGLLTPKLKTQLEEKLSELAGSAALLERMSLRLARSREALVGRLEQILAGGGEVTSEVLDEIEELLITADIGPQTSLAIVDKLRHQVAAGELRGAESLKNAVRELMSNILRKSSGKLELQPNPPTFILMVGVNGAGKTTTIAKLAHRFKQEGKNVLLVAGDTFRAGAIEQLQIWADRVGVPLIRQQENSDPSAVVFDGAQAARARKAEVVIIDTAGRLQTKVNLMEELRKLVRVLQRQHEGAPHEVLLVLDGTAGQNALSQAKLFAEAANVTGVVLTKLDGTAKGGIIVSIANELQLPIKLIGIGERMTDLRDFEPDLFVEALFGQRTESENTKKSTQET